MEKATLDKIRKELQDKQRQLTKELEQISQNGENGYRAKFPEFGDKEEENAQEIGEYTTNLATEKVLESALRDINNALKRIENGTYGICKYCKQEINEKRLLARPVASACVECKSKLQNQ